MKEVDQKRNELIKWSERENEEEKIIERGYDVVEKQAKNGGEHDGNRTKSELKEEKKRQRKVE